MCIFTQHGVNKNFRITTLRLSEIYFLPLSALLLFYQKTVNNGDNVLPNNDDNAPIAHDINVRTGIAFREMTKYSYEEIINVLHPSYLAVAEESTNNATSALHNGSVVDVDTAFDGTWQKRVFVSLNGIVTCIDERTNDKCVDI